MCFVRFSSFKRSTRESTPCSLVMEADATVNPGSATRRTNLNTTAQRTRDSILRNIPSAQEMEEFFTFAEQQQQRLFMEKYVVFNSTDTVIFKRVLLSTNVKILFFINRYNFDVVNDLPLTGRYEWIRVDY